MVLMSEKNSGSKRRGHREIAMCVSCEGSCCRRQSGHCLPSEFGSEDAVRDAVTSGKYGIVLLVDEAIVARVVRPSYKDLDRGTGCIFHRADGCELNFEDRPYGCRMLRPRARDGEHCKPEGISIAEAAEMWEQSGYLPPLSECLSHYPELLSIARRKK